MEDLKNIGPILGIIAMVLFFIGIETTRGFTDKSDLGNALAGLAIALFVIGLMLSALS